MTNPKFVLLGLPPPGWMLGAWVAGAILTECPSCYVLMWPALVYALVVYFYAFDGTIGAHLMGKATSTGQNSVFSLIFFSPFLCTSWIVWWFRHTFVHFREQPYNNIAPGIFLGRYPTYRRSEDKVWWWPCAFPLAEGAAADAARRGAGATECGVGVVDMCAEFPAQRDIVKQARGKYRCLPCLDGDMPADVPAFVAMCKEVAAWGSEQPVYVHCANGRGRSACVVAMVLVLRGLATDIESAWAMIRQERPQCNIGSSQRAILMAAMQLARNENGGESATTADSTPAVTVEMSSSVTSRGQNGNQSGLAKSTV